jgi:hypothetical protein
MSAALVVGEPEGRTSNTPPSMCQPATCQPEGLDAGEAYDLPTAEELEETYGLLVPRRARLVASGVDSLYLSAYVALPKEQLEELERAKLSAQSGNPVLVTFGGQEFAVAPSGAGPNHAYALVNKSMRLGVSRHLGDKVPQLKFQIASETLWARGLDASWLLCQGIAETVHWGEGDPRILVSRVDLAADYEGVPFGSARVEEFVSRARSKNRHKVENEAVEHWDGRVISGFVLGRGDLSARIYDKTREIKRSGKAWFRCVWDAALKRRGEAPLQEGGSVWRVEVQLRREPVKTFRPEDGGAENGDGPLSSVDSLPGLRAVLAAMWRYTVGGERDARDTKDGEAYGWTPWLDWRKEDRSQRAKRRTRDEWRVVQATRFEAQGPCPLVRVKSARATEEQLVAGLAGYMASVAALSGHGQKDKNGAPLLSVFMHWLRERIDAYLDEKDRSWAEAVARKRVLLVAQDEEAPWNTTST